ncbi:hypothetical protein GS597_02640 [Synechococcales cyanobacterium C]|uniref:Uncharacterized protein n=1 Tax=Petrachloros mirabilis ULC683 TaxID=2781853 RepID=A0A8K1ZWK5_9CYAN|nr:hypothetical protein [Petrachloros mirabilis]NCJ05427.1 hypothetical protein [Petrachloros mirabilis ULC683]
MQIWHKAILVIVSILFIFFSITKYAMSSDQHDKSSKYRVENVTPKNSKMKLNIEALRQLNQEAFLIATVKVVSEGYVPSGIEIRTWVTPLIFTANIPWEILDCLESDSAVVSIEPSYKLRP